MIDRNTLGSPQVVLRGGPSSGATVEPPFGQGSLGLSVEGTPRVPTANDAEQATFGNQVDFVGETVASIASSGSTSTRRARTTAAATRTCR